MASASASNSTNPARSDSENLNPEQDSDKADKEIDNLRCPVCLDLFEDPKLLPCGHMACRKCLLNWLEANTLPKRCPECRANITEENVCKLSATLTPEEICEALPTNTITRSLVEAARKLRSADVCDKCGGGGGGGGEEERASSMCLTCFLKLCPKCRRKHAKTSNKKVATALAKREAAVAEAGGSDLGLDAEHPNIPYVPLSWHRIEQLSGQLTPTHLCNHRGNKCPDHEGEYAWRLYYCETHEKPLCALCIPGVHSTCEVITAEAKHKKAEKILEETTKKLKNHDKMLQKRYDGLTQKENELELKSKTMQAELDVVMDRMLLRLEQAREKVKQEISQTDTLPPEQRLKRQSSLLQDFCTNVKGMVSLDEAKKVVHRFEDDTQKVMQEVSPKTDSASGQTQQVSTQHRHQRRQHLVSVDHTLSELSEYLNNQQEQVMSSLEKSIETIEKAIKSDDDNTAANVTRGAASSNNESSSDSGGDTKNSAAAAVAHSSLPPSRPGRHISDID
ncbi:putative E3 ubiquitin-protein ligase MID2 [Babylonia areolata]|uniref:putative E3 ubiquitin-protein ligase MID2 n=1 Tax=Babylonia areolata TaxID=304850 RepID=UPI003FD2A6A3